MAFINYNLTATPMPMYTYILQPPITLLRNHQLITPPTNQEIKAEISNNCDNNNLNDVMELKEEIQSDEEADNKVSLNINIKDEPEEEEEKLQDFEETEITIKKEEIVEDQLISSKSKKIYKCPHCAYTTNWRGNLNKHVVSRHTKSEEIKWLQCEHCSYKGKTRDYLKCHLLHCHNVSVKWHECDRCPFKAKLKSHLERHVIVNHKKSDEIQWLHCDHCNYKAKFRSNLKQHCLSYHVDVNKIQWFKCEFCDFKAKRKRNLQFHHLNKHTDEDKIEWFYCKFCGQKFKRKQTWKVHVDLIHGAERNRKKVKTKEIPVFIDNKLCWRRVVVNEEDSEFLQESCLKCEQCNLDFEDREIFKRHMLKTHTVTEIQKEDDKLVKKTYRTRDVIVLVDDIPVIKKVIDHPLS